MKKILSTLERQIKSGSKYLSYILRHHPEEIGVDMDSKGWVNVEQLIDKSIQYGQLLDNSLVTQIVSTNNKQRFAISGNGQMIRANQGHSVKIELDLEATSPPAVLLHGTAQKNAEQINAQGLSKMQRHHVHLSQNKDTAMAVGCRYGKLLLLEIDATRMVDDGFVFYKTVNAVWLVGHVPAEYIKKIDC
ncbi:MAG: RNA 2'-phosphotransferase [Kangiellaceae bacterium]|nr:RNA 2'-phosphotransferase [Kangiellaceae bacterium]